MESIEMTNRELLVLAAQAAGIADGAVFYDMENDKEWNPLTDDGDALRLAVKLKLEGIIWYGDTTVASDFAETEKVQHEDDPYAATRRAIVRAAAEIGRAMK